jgi:hypothetical protein
VATKEFKDTQTDNWRIAFGSIPMYSKDKEVAEQSAMLRDGLYSDEGWVRTKQWGMREEFKSANVDAYFSGHDRVFQYKKADNIHHFACGASGAYKSEFGGGENADMQMDWWDTGKSSGFVVVRLKSFEMNVWYISNHGETGDVLLNKVTVEKPSHRQQIEDLKATL